MAASEEAVAEQEAGAVEPYAWQSCMGQGTEEGHQAARRDPRTGSFKTWTLSVISLSVGRYGFL